LAFACSAKATNFVSSMSISPTIPSAIVKISSGINLMFMNRIF
jgi:hypothetical protein